MLKSQHRYQSPMALDLAVMHLCIGGGTACISLDVAWPGDSRQACRGSIIGATLSMTLLEPWSRSVEIFVFPAVRCTTPID